jgi:glycosyltransferase involved in cell wall biosynthesis
MIKRILKESKLKWCEVKEVENVNLRDYDVVILDTFMDENMLLQLYGAANVVVLPYLNTRQISSGILADAIGSGRVAVTTKFMYALELLSPKDPEREGVLIDPHARGILVDAGKPSIEQIARALDYVAFNTEARFLMESRAYERGVEMKWDNVASKLLQYIDFLRGKRERITDTSIQFDRKKESGLAQANAALLGSEGQGVP